MARFSAVSASANTARLADFNIAARSPYRAQRHMGTGVSQLQFRDHYRSVQVACSRTAGQVRTSSLASSRRCFRAACTDRRREESIARKTGRGDSRCQPARIYVLHTHIKAGRYRSSAVFLLFVLVILYFLFFRASFIFLRVEVLFAFVFRGAEMAERPPPLALEAVAGAPSPAAPHGSHGGRSHGHRKTPHRHGHRHGQAEHHAAHKPHADDAEVDGHDEKEAVEFLQVALAVRAAAANEPR